MMRCLTSILCFTILFAHDPEAKLPDWKQYYRLGAVNVGTEYLGLASYGRLKRTTESTFRDLRFFGHFFKEDQEIRVRQKTSRRFLSFNRYYTYNTLVYEKNTFINVDLRYHYNQGLGWFIRRSEVGNMTGEFGIAFDNSDYLNTTQKTNYVRTGFTADQTMGKLETKLELDYFYQLSERVAGTDLSRFQLVGEIQYSIKKGLSILCGITQDFHRGESFNFNTASVFLTLAMKRPLNWNF